MKTSRVVMSLFVALFIGHQCAIAQEKIGRITLAKSADIKAIDYRIRVKFNLDDHNYQVTIKNLTTSTEVSHILQHVLPADLSNLLLAQIKKESDGNNTGPTS
jgi:transcriptional antiterminator